MSARFDARRLCPSGRMSDGTDLSALQVEVAHLRQYCSQLESGLKNKPILIRNNTILFVSHEASRTGAPIVLLNIMRWLRTCVPNKLRIILRSAGPLEAEFRELGEVQVLNEAQIPEACLHDVCLVYSNTICNGLFLRPLSNGTIPVITHVHELAGSIELLGVENFQCVKNHSSHFIACSQCVADMLIHTHDIKPSDITVILESVRPLEIRRAAQDLDPSKLRRILGSDPRDFVIAGCGRVDIRKGADLFIQLAEYCRKRASEGRRVRFVWIGDVPNDFSSGIFVQDVRKLGIPDDVQFIGQLENPYPYLRAADLFCLPSREDPLPLVMLEAAALGKPILAFQGSGGAEEFCRKGGGFLVPYLNVQAMGDWILDHIEEKAVLEGMADRAQRLVEREYCIEETGPRYTEVISRFSRLRTDMIAGNGRLFLLNATGQAEITLDQPILSQRWTRIRFPFVSGCRRVSTLRFDPLDRMSMIEIAGLYLRSFKEHRTVWKTEKPEEFSTIQVTGTAVRFPDSRFLKLINLGESPILITPPLNLGSEEAEYRFEVVMRVDARVHSVTRSCGPLISAYRERDAVLSQTDNLGRQVEKLRQELADLRLQQFWNRIDTKGRDVYIWGTGSAGGQMASVMIRNHLEFVGFIDGDVKKNGKQLLEHSVSTPSTLPRKGAQRPFIIVCSIFFRQIEKRLIRRGYVRGKDYERSPLS
jgi:glycosyltransferase involved in cell wall biosynthesis